MSDRSSRFRNHWRWQVLIVALAVGVTTSTFLSGPAGAYVGLTVFDPATISGAITDLASANAAVGERSVDKAIKKLTDALDRFDGTELDAKSVEEVFDDLSKAVEHLLKADRHLAKLPAGSNVELLRQTTGEVGDQLVWLARDVAQQAIDDALAAHRDPKDIARAVDKMTKALSSLDKNKPAEAVRRFGDAWTKAHGASAVICVPHRDAYKSKTVRSDDVAEKIAKYGGGEVFTAVPGQVGFMFGQDCSLLPDADGDLVPDANDNCPAVANADQADFDGDGIGDVCDPDIDGDTVDNEIDNCPLVPNADQSNRYGSLKGDLCEDDSDGDGVLDPDEADICVSVDGFEVVRFGSGAAQCTSTQSTGLFPNIAVADDGASAIATNGANNTAIATGSGAAATAGDGANNTAIATAEATATATPGDANTATATATATVGNNNAATATATAGPGDRNAAAATASATNGDDNAATATAGATNGDDNTATATAGATNGYFATFTATATVDGEDGYTVTAGASGTAGSGTATVMVPPGTISLSGSGSHSGSIAS